MTLIDRIVELVAEGWEPIPSGNGEYLYLRKGDSTDPPLPPGCLLGMGWLAGDRWFWVRVEERKRKDVVA